MNNPGKRLLNIIWSTQTKKDYCTFIQLQTHVNGTFWFAVMKGSIMSHIWNIIKCSLILQLTYSTRPVLWRSQIQFLPWIINFLFLWFLQPLPISLFFFLHWCIQQFYYYNSLLWPYSWMAARKLFPTLRAEPLLSLSFIHGKIGSAQI